MLVCDPILLNFKTCGRDVMSQWCQHKKSEIIFAFSQERNLLIVVGPNFHLMVDILSIKAFWHASNELVIFNSVGRGFIKSAPLKVWDMTDCSNDLVSL